MVHNWSQLAYNLVMPLGFPRRPGPRRKLSPEQEDQLVRLYLDGVPIDELRAQFGNCSKGLIYKVLHRAGITRRQ